MIERERESEMQGDMGELSLVHMYMYILFVYSINQLLSCKYQCHFLWGRGQISFRLSHCFWRDL